MTGPDYGDGLRAEVEALRLELSGVYDLLRLQIEQNVAVRDGADRLVALLRNQHHNDEPYNQACRDVAHLVYDLAHPTEERP